MKEILRLALRNLKEHKTKTIIIALFFIFGVAIVVLGNSFLESVNRGLEKDFRANYTGDIAISIQPGQGELIDIFGVQTTNMTGDLPQIPAIPDLEKVQQIVNETPEIKNQTKLISAMVMVAKGVEMDMSELVNRDDLTFDDLPVSMLFSGENETYWKTFPDVHFVEGRYPEPGKGNKTWIVDIDNTNIDSKLVKDIKDIIVNYCQPFDVEKIVAVIPTKSGVHLITRPFNQEVFYRMFSQFKLSIENEVDIKKDNPTVLYVP